MAELATLRQTPFSYKLKHFQAANMGPRLNRLCDLKFLGKIALSERSELRFYREKNFN